MHTLSTPIAYIAAMDPSLLVIMKVTVLLLSVRDYEQGH